MIKKKITYKIKFTEKQVKELHRLLKGEFHDGSLERDHGELLFTYIELEKLFHRG